MIIYPNQGSFLTSESGTGVGPDEVIEVLKNHIKTDRKKRP